MLLVRWFFIGIGKYFFIIKDLKREGILECNKDVRYIVEYREYYV